MTVPWQKKKPWTRTYIEGEPTCPGGGRMKYTVSVSEPNRSLGEQSAFIGVDEGSTEHSEKDSMLLDLPTARWMVDALKAAIEEAERVEREAKSS